MERVQDAEQTVEVFENEIQMYLSMFCESNAIESEYDILPSQWNAALSYIYKHVIKPNPDILTIPHTVSNSYNITLEDGEVCMGVYNNREKEWWTRKQEGERWYTNKHNVIAWQPLPEPYKEEKKC